eukprot:gene13949-29688_t
MGTTAFRLLVITLGLSSVIFVHGVASSTQIPSKAPSKKPTSKPSKKPSQKPTNVPAFPTFYPTSDDQPFFCGLIDSSIASLPGDWKCTTPGCLWSHVTCTAGAMTSLDLTNLGITFYSIPTSLGHFKTLTSLKLGGNYLSMDYPALPSELLLLSNLRELTVGDLGLTGPVPEISGVNMPNLVSLSLSYNGFTGVIPTTLFSLTKLTALYLGNNQLTLDIPTGFAQMSSLQLMYVQNNNFTYWIDGPSLGQMMRLKELDLSNNTFTNAIPTELGKLTNLLLLDLSLNKFSTSIPSELGNLKLLTELRMTS